MSKTFEILYKRTKTGAIQQWGIEVKDDVTPPVIVKRAGQVGGKLTMHTEPVPVGKQKRTASEQALAQAESDWKKKHDEGYKTLKDLGHLVVGPTPEAYYQNINTRKIYDDIVLPVLNKALPQFNTDASGNVKPMLAKAVNWDKVQYPCLIQPKLDGVRCLMISSLVENNPSTIFLSRSGKEYTTLDHIRADVDAYQYSQAPGNFILDGEIYSDELTFQEIVAAVKKQRPDSLKLHFRVYDIVNDEIQTLRSKQFHEVVEQLKSAYVHPVTTIHVADKSRVKELHDEWVVNGYEGAMIRHYTGTYGQGQRSSDLLKVKEFDENEYAFLRFEHGQRGVEDLIAVCITEDNKEFRAKMVGTKQSKEQLYDNMSEVEGKSFTIKHFGLTTDGLPRFPIGKGFRNYE